MSSFKKISSFITFCYFGLIPSVVSAQSDSTYRKFYVGVNMGTGLLQLSKNDLTSDRNARYALGFCGGYIPFKWLWVGFDLNGWLIEPYGNFYKDPAKGISISNFYGEFKLFPFKAPRVFANIAGGFSNYINHHPDGSNANGRGALLGFGYKMDLTKRLELFFIVNYGFGRFNDVNNLAAHAYNQHYDVIGFLLGASFH